MYCGFIPSGSGAPIARSYFRYSLQSLSSFSPIIFFLQLLRLLHHRHVVLLSNSIIILKIALHQATDSFQILK